MLQYWKFGNYTFTHNPNEESRRIEKVGDEIITQNGRVISLPTSFSEQMKLTCQLYQPSTKLTYQYTNINNNCLAIAYDTVNNRFYLADHETGKIYVKSGNWSDITNFTLSVTSKKDIMGLCIVNGFLWVYIYDMMGSGAYAGILVKVSLSNYATQTLYQSNIYSYGKDMAITEDGVNIFTIDSHGQIWKITLGNPMTSTLAWEIEVQTEPKYYGLTYDGRYYWTYDCKNGRFLQLDIENKKIINSFENREPNLDSAGSLTFMPSKFIIYVDNTSNRIDVYRPNTVKADVHSLLQEAMKGEVAIINEVGISKEVSIISFNPRRKESYEVMYEVEMLVDILN